VVVSSGQIAAAPALSHGRDREGSSPEVVWHDLECGAYRADLPLWRELAEVASSVPGRARILDVGAGTGRVALDLARGGHGVTALDSDPALLGGLRWRAGDLDVEIVWADARAFELDRRDFGLCIVPMNTIQLLGGSAGRIAFLRHARAHLRPGGLLACTIIAGAEPFDCSRGDPEPSAETVRVGRLSYVSRMTRVSVREQTLLIERERRIISDAAEGVDSPEPLPPDAVEDRSPGKRSPPRAPAERELITLDRVGVSQLEREGIEAGLRPEPRRGVPATEEHTGSPVVMLRA
jgi:SAM-dependent methyltransferase